jgi:hypothetical protein
MDEREVLRIIEEAAGDGRKELDLSNKGIKSLPADIGMECTQGLKGTVSGKAHRPIKSTFHIYAL